MSSFKIASIKIRHRHEPQKGVDSIIVADDFTLAFPEKYIVINDDPVFLRLISEDWRSCKLLSYLPSRTFNRLVKAAVEFNNKRGVFFKKYLFDIKNNCKIIDNKKATQYINQLISEHPALGIIFEEYTNKSGFSQFKIGLKETRIKAILNLLEINPSIKHAIFNMWSMKTIYDKDIYIFRKIKLNNLGYITNPLVDNDKIFISSSLPAHSTILMMYGFLEKKLLIFQDGNSQPLKILRLSQEKKRKYEILENPMAQSIVNLYRFYRANLIPNNINLNDLQLGVNLLSNVEMTHFNKLYISASVNERLPLPKKWHNILNGVETKCHLAVIKKAISNKFKLFLGLVFDFQYNYKKYQLIYINIDGKNQSVTIDQIRQFSISLKDIKDNIIHLPHLKSTIIVDNKDWNKIIIILDNNHKIVGIKKVYAKSEASHVDIKRIQSFYTSDVDRILVSPFQNFSKQVKKHITGILEVSPTFATKELSFNIGMELVSENLHFGTIINYSGFDINLFNLIKSGLILKPEKIPTANTESISANADTINFPSNFIRNLQKSNVDIGDLIDWVKTKKYISKTVAIDFDTLTPEQSQLIIENMTNHFITNSNGSLSPKLLASRLLNELKELYSKFSPNHLKSYAVIENGFPIGYIFQYKGKFFNPYELITIRSKNNTIVLSSKIIRNKKIIKHAELYKYELNRIICVDKLVNFHEKGWEEKRRFTIDNQTFVHLIKSGKLPRDKRYKAISRQMLEEKIAGINILSYRVPRLHLS